MNVLLLLAYYIVCVPCRLLAPDTALSERNHANTARRTDTHQHTACSHVSCSTSPPHCQPHASLLKNGARHLPQTDRLSARPQTDRLHALARRRPIRNACTHCAPPLPHSHTHTTTTTPSAPSCQPPPCSCNGATPQLRPLQPLRWLHRTAAPASAPQGYSTAAGWTRSEPCWRPWRCQSGCLRRARVALRWRAVRQWTANERHVLCAQQGDGSTQGSSRSAAAHGRRSARAALVAADCRRRAQLPRDPRARAARRTSAEEEEGGRAADAEALEQRLARGVGVAKELQEDHLAVRAGNLLVRLADALAGPARAVLCECVATEGARASARCCCASEGALRSAPCVR